jgi:hypothetical protein
MLKKGRGEGSTKNTNAKNQQRHRVYRRHGCFGQVIPVVLPIPDRGGVTMLFGEWVSLNSRGKKGIYDAVLAVSF